MRIPLVKKEIFSRRTPQRGIRMTFSSPWQGIVHFGATRLAPARKCFEFFLAGLLLATHVSSPTWLSAHLSCSEALTRLYRTTSPEFGYCLCWCYQTKYVAVTKLSPFFCTYAVIKWLVFNKFHSVTEHFTNESQESQHLPMST